MISDLLRVQTVTIDCDDASVVARFWCQLLGYEVVPNHTDSVATRHPRGSGPPLLFTWAGSAKSGKSSIHLDLRPTDQAQAVARAVELGARHADIGQTGDERWVVLQDPEGNEFCILQSEEELERWQTTVTGPEPSM